jgi:hypothetical protein
MARHISRKASWFVFLLVVLMFLAGVASAQVAQPDNNVEQPAVRVISTVTASATAERVRFTSPNTVVQLRLEVYDETGQKLLDTEQRGGNVLDWHLQGGAGERVADGVYLCVLTSKNLSGRLSQKLGLVTVSGQAAVVRTAAVAELSLRQAQTVGPVETGEAGLTVMGPEDTPPVTVLANSGNEGQLARTRGALTFRVGDFFSGADKEQMRLTEDGNLGIGTTKPKVKLDVAGTIRAERFLIAKPKLAKGDKAAPDAQTTDAVDSVQPLIAGSGTLNHIAKWTPDGSTLGDSGIFETNGGLVGIGTPTPAQALEVANGRIVTTGIQTLAADGGILEIGTTVTNDSNGASGIRMRNTFNGNASFQQALDVAPTFAPSASITLARGFISTAFFAPPPGVTITDAYGGNANTVYLNTTGAVTNGTGFAIRTPIVFGALKPTNQYGLHILNQGIAGTTNSYGLFVDAQSGSTNNYSAIFAGGNVGIGTSSPAQALHVLADQGASQTVGVVIENKNILLGGERTVVLDLKNNAIGKTYRLQTVAGATDRTGTFDIWDVGAGASRFTIDASGKVGIGTTGPAQRLEVVGNVKVSGGGNGFIFADNTTMTTAGATLGANSFNGNQSVTGTITATGSINTDTQYNIGGNRVLSVQAVYDDLFAGLSAGASNTTGQQNAFFGTSAGANNTAGNGNSFFGYVAGVSNNMDGSFNSFFGRLAGRHNTTGNENVFVGDSTGQSNSTESNNTFIGASANGAAAITNATAIGSNASVTQSNSLVLGSINGVNNATSNTKVGIGTPAPLTSLHVRKDAASALGPALTLMNGAGGTGSAAAVDFDGYDTGANPPSARLQSLDDGNFSSHLAFLTKVPGAAANSLAERLRITSSGNVGIGTTGPNAKLHVAGGDVAITTQSNGVILRATDGANCYRVTVNNAGTLSTAAVTCP